MKYIDDFERNPVNEKDHGAFIDNTNLIPSLIADSVCSEILILADKKDLLDPGVEEMYVEGGRIHDYLINRAVTIWKNNKPFAERLKSREGRDLINCFMRHWAAGATQKLAPSLYRTLPKSFSRGEPIAA